MAFTFMRRYATALLRLTGAILVVPVVAVATAGEPGEPSQTSSGSRTIASDDGLRELQRAAINRALPYIARQTQLWIDQKKCTSCHQIPHALWAMNEARSAGFTADSRLAEWNRWAVDFVQKKTEKSGGSVEAARDSVDEAGQILLFGIDSHADQSKGTDNRASVEEQLLSSLHRGRDEDQLWHAGGQLPDQKRPLQETNEVTTMWTLLALRSKSSNRSKAIAKENLTSPAIANNSVSIEHMSLRYMLAFAEGARGRADSLRAEILAHQNKDGGWGWLLDGPSDALATGQALYALSKAAPEHRRDAATRAHHYLIRTQHPDGSWSVPSTLAAKKEQAYVVSNDWGTSWAVIGLLSTMEHEEATARHVKPH